MADKYWPGGCDVNMQSQGILERDYSTWLVKKLDNCSTPHPAFIAPCPLPPAPGQHHDSGMRSDWNTASLPAGRMQRENLQGRSHPRLPKETLSKDGDIGQDLDSSRSRC